MRTLKPRCLLLILFAASAASAQQKFPLRSGEWTATTAIPGQSPSVNLFCMNDETWTKALAGKSACQLQQVHITTAGGSYHLACGGQSFQMTGDIRLSFDGMTHMTANGSFDITVNGGVTHSNSTTDYRWNSSTCNPDKDLNLINRNRPHP